MRYVYVQNCTITVPRHCCTFQWYYWYYAWLLLVRYEIKAVR
jgi:hypothetical protein